MTLTGLAGPSLPILFLCAAGGQAAGESDPLRLRWEANLLTVASEVVPGGSIEIRYLEAFCRKGAHDRDWRETVIPHETRLLHSAADGSILELETRVEPGVVVSHRISAGTDQVDFDLVLTNETAREADIEWAQPCMRVGRFTGLGQKDYFGRCFIFTEAGPTFLDRTRRTEEARYRGGQVYVPSGVEPADVNPRPISLDTPVNALIGCFSSDGKWILATAWEPAEELFQGVIVCIHSDFRIGGLAAGETKRVRGKVYLATDDPEALLSRYERDFGKD